MKKLACIITVLLLLSATVTLAETSLREYRDECPHLFWLMTEQNVTQMESGERESITAKCAYCELSYEILMPGALQRQSSRRYELSCIHAFRLDEAIVADGYYPTNQISGAHQFRYLMTATCEKCSEQIDVYNAPGVGNAESHKYIETGTHFHIDETNQHAIVYECSVCGYLSGVMVDCVMFDIGLCTKTLRDMGYLQIPDWYKTIGQPAE